MSEAFRGKSRIERHRMINATLGGELAGGVHALALHVAAPGEVRSSSPGRAPCGAEAQRDGGSEIRERSRGLNDEPGYRRAGPGCRSIGLLARFLLGQRGDLVVEPRQFALPFGIVGRPLGETIEDRLALAQ